MYSNFLIVSCKLKPVEIEKIMKILVTCDNSCIYDPETREKIITPALTTGYESLPADQVLLMLAGCCVSRQPSVASVALH